MPAAAMAVAKLYNQEFATRDLRGPCNGAAKQLCLPEFFPVALGNPGPVALVHPHPLQTSHPETVSGQIQECLLPPRRVAGMSGGPEAPEDQSQ